MCECEVPQVASSPWGFGFIIHWCWQLWMRRKCLYIWLRKGGGGGADICFFSVDHLVPFKIYADPFAQLGSNVPIILILICQFWRQLVPLMPKPPCSEGSCPLCQLQGRVVRWRLIAVCLCRWSLPSISLRSSCGHHPAICSRRRVICVLKIGKVSSGSAG